MSKRLSVLVVTLLLLLAYRGLAQATYYHFENNRLDDISFNSASSVVYSSSSVYSENTVFKSYEWMFDLNKDTMDLWEMSVPLYNSGAAWDPNLVSHTLGAMSPWDKLHHAYLAMQLCKITGDTFNIYFDTVLQTNLVTVGNGNNGCIDVYTELYTDHFLKVTMTAVAGDFSVGFMNLAGCYEVSAVVPEPGTLLLLGGGLIGMILLLRSKGSGGA